MKKLLFFPLFLILLVLPINALEFQYTSYEAGTYESQLSSLYSFLYSFRVIPSQVALEGVEYDCLSQFSSNSFVAGNQPTTSYFNPSFTWGRVVITADGREVDSTFAKKGQTLAFNLIQGKTYIYNIYRCNERVSTLPCSVGYIKGSEQCVGTQLYKSYLKENCNTEKIFFANCPTGCREGIGCVGDSTQLPNIPKCDESVKNSCLGLYWVNSFNTLVFENNQYSCKNYEQNTYCEAGCDNGQCKSASVSECLGIFTYYDKSKNCGSVLTSNKCADNINTFKTLAECQGTGKICPSVCTPLYVLSSDCKLSQCGSGCGADNINTFKTLAECQGTGKICPSVCTPLYVLSSDCKLSQCGSGCGADNINTFKTLAECQGKTIPTPTIGSGGGVTQTGSGVTSSGCTKDGEPAQYTLQSRGINNNCCSGKTSEEICLADNPTSSDDESSTDADKKKVTEGGTAKNVTIFKPFAISIQDSELGEASSGSIVRAICHVSENCLSYEDLQGNTNYSVRCVSTSTTEQKIEEATKKECDKFTPKLLTSIGGVGFAGCLSGIALMLSGVGAIVGASLASLCVATPIGITAVGSTQLALEAGCELNKQKLGDGLCIATKKQANGGSFVDSLKGVLESVGTSLNNAFGGESKTGITGITMGYILLVFVIFIIIILWNRK